MTLVSSWLTSARNAKGNIESYAFLNMYVCYVLINQSVSQSVSGDDPNDRGVGKIGNF